MPTPRTVLAPLLLVTLLAMGCSSGESGSPAAQDPPSETEQETTSAGPSADRPAPIDLTAVDVCQVMSAMPLADFGLDTGRPPLAGESDLFPGAKDCFANGPADNVSLLIVAVTDQDARSYVETANAGKSEADAAGYPLTVLTPTNPNSCLGVVDVHDEQMLYLSYALSSPLEQPVTPQPELCRTVPAIATAAIGALG